MDLSWGAVMAGAKAEVQLDFPLLRPLSEHGCLTLSGQASTSDTTEATQGGPCENRTSPPWPSQHVEAMCGLVSLAHCYETGKTCALGLRQEQGVPRLQEEGVMHGFCMSASIMHAVDRI